VLFSRLRPINNSSGGQLAAPYVMMSHQRPIFSWLFTPRSKYAHKHVSPRLDSPTALYTRLYHSPRQTCSQVNFSAITLSHSSVYMLISFPWQTCSQVNFSPFTLSHSSVYTFISFPVANKFASLFLRNCTLPQLSMRVCIDHFNFIWRFLHKKQ